MSVHWGVIRKYASAHISAAGEELDEGIAGLNDKGSHLNRHHDVLLVRFVEFVVQITMVTGP